MNEENNKMPSQDEGIPASAPLNSENIEANNSQAENIPQPTENIQPVQDVSKVKIRTVLKQRIKNWRPGVRRAIAYILVAVIFFAAGFGVDRAMMRHRGLRGNYGKPGIYKSYQGGRSSSRQFNNRKGMVPGKLKPGANQKPQTNLPSTPNTPKTPS